MSVLEQILLEMCREQAGGVRWCLFWSEHGTRACDFKTVGWRQEADESCGARETNRETLTRGADWASVFGSAGM